MAYKFQFRDVFAQQDAIVDAKALGVKLELTQITGANRLPFLLTDKVDIVISVMRLTPERAKQVMFTAPYANTSLAVYGPKNINVKSIDTVPGVASRWTRISGADDYVFAPCDGYFERRFQLGDPIEKGQLAGMIHQLSRPQIEPEPVYFKAGGTLYAHGVAGHVRAGQNLAVLTEDI